jgi:hypothetical protein
MSQPNADDTQPRYIDKYPDSRPDRRHTRAGETYSIDQPRPTEGAASKRMAGEGGAEEELHPLALKATRRLKRYCLKCRLRKHDRDFEVDKRFPMGLSFYCTSCRKKVARVSWRDHLRKPIEIVPIAAPTYNRELVAQSKRSHSAAAR